MTKFACGDCGSENLATAYFILDGPDKATVTIMCLDCYKWHTYPATAMERITVTEKGQQKVEDEPG